MATPETSEEFIDRCKDMPFALQASEYWKLANEDVLWMLANGSEIAAALGWKPPTETGAQS